MECNDLLERVSLRLAESGYRWEDVPANTEVVVNLAVVVATAEHGAFPGVFVRMTSEYFFLKWVLEQVERAGVQPVPVWRALRWHHANWHRDKDGNLDPQPFGEAVVL